MSVKYMGLIDGMMGVLSSKVKIDKDQQKRSRRSSMDRGIDSLERMMAQRDTNKMKQKISSKLMKPLFDEKVREKAVLPSQEKALERLRQKRALFHEMHNKG